MVQQSTYPLSILLTEKMFNGIESSRSSLARSTGISPVHHASLVDPSTHSLALLQLLDINLSKQMIGEWWISTPRWINPNWPYISSRLRGGLCSRRRGFCSRPSHSFSVPEDLSSNRACQIYQICHECSHSVWSNNTHHPFLAGIYK